VWFWSVTCPQYYTLNIAHCYYLLTGGRFLPFIRISTLRTAHATCIFMSHRVSLVKPSPLQFRALQNVYFTRNYCRYQSSANVPFLSFYSKTNEMRQFFKFILFSSNTLHVSDGLSVHHQESKNVHTASGICQRHSADCLPAGMRWTSFHLVPASKQSTNLYDIYLMLYVQS